MATKGSPPSPARHAADRHDLIRVQGARVNNLKDLDPSLSRHGPVEGVSTVGATSSSRA
jgi:hypothetical protein